MKDKKFSGPGIKSLLQAFEDYKANKIDFQQLESVAMKCIEQLKSEGRRLQDEIRKYQDFVPDEIKSEDMEIKKINKDEGNNI